MNTAVRVVILVACAAILCPSAEALDPVRLALMPLPRQALGPDAAALPLANDSGVDSNADAARHAGPGVTAADLASDGRITGYTLDYARSATATLPARRLLEVQTIAELYRDGSSATKGLAFWQTITKRLNTRAANGFTIRLKPFAAHLADGAFGFELTYLREGRPYAYAGDIVFRTGNLLGAVFATASDDAGLRARTMRLASRLATRIRQVRAGKLNGSPVPLPGAA